MPDTATGPKDRPIATAPSKRGHHRRKKNRRVSNPAGKDNVCARLQGLDDRLSAKIGFSRDDSIGKRLTGLSVFQ